MVLKSYCFISDLPGVCTLVIFISFIRVIFRDEGSWATLGSAQGLLPAQFSGAVVDSA